MSTSSCRLAFIVPRSKQGWDRGFHRSKLYFLPMPSDTQIFRVFPTWGCIWVINQELLERAEMLANEGWLLHLKVCLVKSTVCKLRISFFPRKRDAFEHLSQKKIKKIHDPKKRKGLWCFKQTQRLLHIVWAKCITSLKVWTIACLGEAGPRGPICKNMRGSHIWDHLPKGTKNRKKISV